METKNQIAGKDFKDFLKDDSYWPSGSSMDDDSFIINGDLYGDDGRDRIPMEEIGDATSVIINSGDFLMHGSRVSSLQKHFDSWFSQNKNVTLTFTVERAHVDAAKRALIAAGVNPKFGSQS